MATNLQNAPDDGSGYGVGTRTHIGLRRKRNEDFLDVRQTPHGLLVVVCDGMGGPGNGDRASRMAVEAFVEAIPSEPISPATLLTDGVERANKSIIAEIERDRNYTGMGTTLVGVLIKGNHATIVNVGDSRAYRYASGTLSRVSRDHSLVGELVERGEITEEEAARHPRRNIITRALGSDPVLAADIYELDLSRGDTLLLSTDGLHGMISDAEITEVLARGGDPAVLCDLLVERALMAGGDDNITVALVRFNQGEVFREVPTDPGDKPRQKGSGGGPGGIVAGVVMLLVLATAAWFLWLRPSVTRDGRTVGYDSTADTIVVPAPGADSSGWIDMQGSPPQQGDTIRPGDTIQW